MAAGKVVGRDTCACICEVTIESFENTWTSCVWKKDLEDQWQAL